MNRIVRVLAQLVQWRPPSMRRPRQRGASRRSVRFGLGAWCQRKRRCALWLATYGIDVGPRVIHGVVVR